MDKIMPLYDACQQHRKQYDSGDTDYSVTTLLDPPRIVHLNKRHMAKVELFVEDLLHSFTGTAVHEYMERMLLERDSTMYKCEERLGITINDRKVSGAYDMKNTSCWKVVFGDKDDWTHQQNCYRFLIWMHHKVTLKSLRIIGMFRDWSLVNKWKSGRDYPEYPAVEYQLPLMDLQKVHNWMTDRVTILAAEENTADDDLPLCTYEDMWSKPDQVAVKTTRLKRALRVCTDMQKAKAWVSTYLSKDTCKDKFADLRFEVRPAERKRCESWCPINRYCNQYNNYLKAKAKG